MNVTGRDKVNEEGAVAEATGSADWNGREPESGSMTRRSVRGNVWARRKVRPDGTVRFLGHTFAPKPDVITRPVPGEWLLVYDYGPDYIHNPYMGEWTAPADPDGFIRRMDWMLLPATAGAASSTTSSSTSGDRP